LVLVIGALGLAVPGVALAAPAAGTISTVAGDPLASGPATSLGQEPRAVAAGPGGVLYIVDGASSTIREVGSTGRETTVAGVGGPGYSGDGGPATGAALSSPTGVAVDGNGDLLIADLGNERVRLVAGSSCSTSCPYGLASMTTGSIYTIAGDGTAGYSGDGGPATSAELSGPGDVAVDGGGDLLIVDAGDDRVRLVAASSCSTDCPFGLAAMTKGDMYTIAGNGAQGYSGDGGRATSAELFSPAAVAVDGGGDLLIADADNERVRLVAGSSCSSGCPYGLAAMTRGDIYTIAGGGSAYPGDGGPATSAELETPDGVALDGSGDLLISDQGNERVRLVAGSSCASGCPFGLASMTAGDIYTIAGNGTQGYSGDGGRATSAELFFPGGLGVDGGGDLLIADQVNERVRLVAASSCASGCPFGLAAMTRGDIYTIAGNGTDGYSGDGGSATSAELDSPDGVAVDRGGDLLITDPANGRVRLVAATSCSTDCPFGLAAMTKGDVYTVAGNGTQGYSGDAGAATSAKLSYPEGVAVDSEGDLLIADTDNERVRLVAGSSCSTSCPFGIASMTKGDIYTVAGDGNYGYSGDGGPATSAKLDGPSGVAVDGDGDLLIADTVNERVELVAGSSCASGCPYGLSSMTKGDIYTIAGDGTRGYSGDGRPAGSAQLDFPYGVAVDGGGDVLIADTGNERVRLVAGSSCSSGCPYGLASMTKGDIYTIAGNGTRGYSGDGGPADSAELYAPGGVAVDGSGDVLIADTANQRVRLVAGSSCSTGCPFGLASMTKGDVYTVAGDGGYGYSGDGGPATRAQIDEPSGLAVDGDGDLLIADSENNRVREVTAQTAGSAEWLSVSLAGPGSGTVTGGGLSCPGACSTAVAAGAAVTLSATPASGSTFVGWSGGGCSGTGGCTVTVNAATTITAFFSVPYAALVESTPGLIGYWPLSDQSGTVATDELGEHDGTYLGGFTLGVPGPIFGVSTTAVGLDGTSGQVKLPALGSFSDWTVEGWTDLNAGAAASPYGDNCLYCGHDGVRLIVLPTGFYADDLTTGTKLGILRGGSASNVASWVYWTLVREGQTLALYRDGVQVGSSSLGSEGASTLDGAIGAYAGSDFLDGDAGQVAAYGTALSAAQIELRYEAGSAGAAGSSPSRTG
jgi:hypothetical protein